MVYRFASHLGDFRLGSGCKFQTVGLGVRFSFGSDLGITFMD